VHILLVTYEFPPFMATGGIGSYMNHLTHLLSDEGHRVTVFSATLQGTHVQKVGNPYCTNYLFPASSLVDFRDAVRLYFHEYFKSHLVDIIESPEVGACALGIKIDYPTIPLIVRLHTPGVIITKVSNTYQPLIEKLRFVAGALRRGKIDLGFWADSDKNKHLDSEYQICCLADRLISPSAALREYIQRFWQLKREIDIIPNPFHSHADLFVQPIAGREKIICFVGKLSVLKGMFALTKAVKIILKKNPNYFFVFAGRDEAASLSIPSMMAWIKEELKDVVDRIQFTGALDSNGVKKLLCKSRVCVVPSLWENFPTVVLEAMAAGTTVAAANRGGIPEIIMDGETGYLFNPICPSEIASTVNNLLADESERVSVSAKARKWIKKFQEESKFPILSLFEV
jgi:glycogen(starch) synthase